MARGFADLHNHQFAHLGFGGVAFHGRPFVPGMHDQPIGLQLPAALPWCDFDRSPTAPGVPLNVIHGAGGQFDTVGNTVREGSFDHRVGGFPQFDGWPRYDSVTHQSVYEEWLQRAVTGGLRLLVMLAVNNEKLANIVFLKPLGTRDMPAVDRQLDAAWAFQEHVDKRAGGPGRGWYRLVFSPDEARTVIQQGKLAVVLGIEVDFPFSGYSDDGFTKARLRNEVDYYYRAGVRHVFPIHFSDNAFGGTAFQNRLQVALPLPGEVLFSMTTINPLNPLDVGLIDTIIHSYRVQTEPAAEYAMRTGRRNTQGLTELGARLVELMIERGMMIDLDHMSARSRSDTLDICEGNNYPVVSGHSGYVSLAHGDKKHEGQLLDREMDRILGLQGMLAAITNQGTRAEIAYYDRNPASGPSVQHNCGRSSNTFAQAYLYAADRAGRRPVGLGTDFNGFIGQPGPRYGGDRCGIRYMEIGEIMAELSRPDPPPPAEMLRYPFHPAALRRGAVMGNSVVGAKTFDVNFDGLAHVGMLPDFIADLEVQGLTAADLAPLLQSAEGYVDAWERAWSNPLHRTDLPAVQRPSVASSGLRGVSFEEDVILLGGSSVGTRNRVRDFEEAVILTFGGSPWGENRERTSEETVILMEG